MKTVKVKLTKEDRMQIALGTKIQCSKCGDTFHKNNEDVSLHEKGPYHYNARLDKYFYVCIKCRIMLS